MIISLSEILRVTKWVRNWSVFIFRQEVECGLPWRWLYFRPLHKFTKTRRGLLMDRQKHPYTMDHHSSCDQFLIWKILNWSPLMLFGTAERLLGYQAGSVDYSGIIPHRAIPSKMYFIIASCRVHISQVSLKLHHLRILLELHWDIKAEAWYIKQIKQITTPHQISYLYNMDVRCILIISVKAWLKVKWYVMHFLSFFYYHIWNIISKWFFGIRLGNTVTTFSSKAFSVCITLFSVIFFQQKKERLPIQV